MAEHKQAYANVSFYILITVSLKTKQSFKHLLFPLITLANMHFTESMKCRERLSCKLDNRKTTHKQDLYKIDQKAM